MMSLRMCVWHGRSRPALPRPDTPTSNDALDERSRAATAQWDQLVTALACFAVDPGGLGGVRICGSYSPVHRRVIDILRSLLEDTPPFKVPPHVTPDNLEGGLDVIGSLGSGGLERRSGLLEGANGRPLLINMADTLSTGAAHVLANSLDAQDRRTSLLAFDEGEAGTTGLDPVLIERLALTGFTDGLRLVDCMFLPFDASDIKRAKARLPSVGIGDAERQLISEMAAAFGIRSLRADLFTARAARCLAALKGRDVALREDCLKAASLTLVPKALHMPQQENDDSPAEPPPPPQSQQTEDAPPQQSDQDNQTFPEDQWIDPLEAGVPATVWSNLMVGAALTVRGKDEGRGKDGDQKSSRGRPGRIRPASLKDKASLDLSATLQQAAVVQPLRRAEQGLQDSTRLLVEADDLRKRDRKRPNKMATIFVVDASGSHAAGRMAQAKGAVLSLLADCYVRRDEVGLIAFRGLQAEVLLPLTRSLVRASRALKILPGGGATPLAHGLELGIRMALQAQREGKRPLLVLVTDGKGNVTRAGEADRALAAEDLAAAAKSAKVAGVPALVLDTSVRRTQRAKALAGMMGAHHLMMPGGGQVAGTISAAVLDAAT